MKVLKSLDAALNKVESALLILMLSAMVLVAFGQVVLREVFRTGLDWGDILLRHLVLWLGFLGAAIATSEERHINIDALRRFLPPRVRSSVDVLTDLCAAFICFLLMQAAYGFVQLDMSSQQTMYQNIPSWYAELIIPVGYGLLVVHFTLRAIMRAHSVLTKDAVR
jgi:TRAP-type C4-dicarboxylate transport system permease small subunit